MKRAFTSVKELVVSNTAKDTTIQFSGSIVSFTFGIIFTILVARLLGPETFGVVVVAVAFVGIVNAVGDLGLGSSLFRYSSKFWQKGETRKARKVFSDIFVFRLLSAFSILVILVILSPILAPALFKVSAPIIVILLAIDIFGFLLTDFQVQAFQSQRKFKHSAFILSLTNIFRVFLLATFSVFWSINLTLVILAYSVAPLIVFSISLLWNKVSVDFSSGWRKTIAKTKGFSSWMGANRIIGAINGRVDALILVQLLGAYQTGIYGAGKQLAYGIPIAVGSFATVLAPRFASFEGDNLKKFFKKSVLLSLLLAGLIAVGVIIAPFIISLFGDQYDESLPILRWLLIAMIPFALFTPATNMIIYSYGKPNFVTTLSLIQMPIIIGLNITLTPIYGVYGPVFVIGLWNLSTLVISYGYLFKLSSRNNLKLI